MKKKALKESLKELKKMMRDDSYEPMQEKLQKVTVMSDSPEGLKEGLSKAEEILEKRKAMFDEGEEEDEESDEGLDMSEMLERAREASEDYYEGGVKPMEASEDLGEGEAYEEDDDKKKEERRRMLTKMLKSGKLRDSGKDKDQ